MEILVRSETGDYMIHFSKTTNTENYSVSLHKSVDTVPNSAFPSKMYTFVATLGNGNDLIWLVITCLEALPNRVGTIKEIYFE